MINNTLPLCIGACAVMIAPAFAADWSTDLEAAKKKAATENKAVLVAFTGSDWCGPCMQLKSAVFDKPEFAAYAKDKLVLVEIDLPKNPKFDPELRKRNEDIGIQYGIRAFPSVMVVTPEGYVVGGFMGGRTDISFVTDTLDAAIANIDKLKKAESLQGDEKLKAIYEVYKSMPAALATTLADRLIEMDKNDVTGIRHETQVARQLEEFGNKFTAAVRADKTMQEKLAIVNEALKDALPDNRIVLLKLKLEIQEALCETVDDVLAAKQTVLEIAEADPASAQALRKFVEEKMSDPAKALEEIKARRPKQ